MISPEDALAGIEERFGHHPGCRALHAKGTLCRGTFTATPAAAELTRAAHLQGQPVEVTARLSNGAGNPHLPDTAPDVRGLAVSFHLLDGSRTDIVSQTAPRFAFRNEEEFMDFLRRSKPGPSMLWKLPPFLAAHPWVLRGTATNALALRPPRSYAACRFFAIHAFRWLDAAGGSRFIRYYWLPDEGESRLSLTEVPGRGRDYLREELLGRFEEGSIRFTLQVQIAAEGDDVDDPSAEWPDERARVDVGTLELTGTDPGDDSLVFDPTRVTDGIELSDDPVLRFRPRVYAMSHERRTGSG